MKYDYDYSRRVFMSNVGKFAGAGVLAPLWPLIASGQSITKAYPDELLSIEGYTKGRIKTGDYITAANVDIVKNLLPPGTYKQVKDMGRRIRIVATTKDVNRLFPHDYLQATLRNAGKAKFGSDGNIYGPNGERWMGGNPFPDAKTGEEASANITLSWGRYDNAVYAVKDWDIGPDGKENYQYDFTWVEENTSGRTGPGGTFGPYTGDVHKDTVRYNSIIFNGPSDIKGTVYLSKWYYDQKKFPELVGYVPAFKRVRKFPTNQRFEPLVPGLTMYLSDAWAAGDPFLTWGNYKIVGRGPLLGAVSQNHMSHPNWVPGVHGGPQNQTFWDIDMELVPECIVVDAEPTSYPRAPYSKKRVWFDVRNMMYMNMTTYDRRGEIFKNFEPSYGLYEKGNNRRMTGNNTTWSWNTVMSHDMQSNRMSRFVQTQDTAGVKSVMNAEGLYEKYMTESAISRLGS